MTEDLLQRKVVRLDEAAEMLAGMSSKTLRAKLAEHGLHLVELGPRIRGVKLADIDTLIAASQRH
jgi:hypothetical protein